jgi:N-acetylmuramoyl-L-alanine amidase
MCWARLKQQLAPGPAPAPAPRVQDAREGPRQPQGAPVVPTAVHPPARPLAPVLGIYPDIEQRISPNAGAAFASSPDALVIHYTASGTATSALGTFADMTPGKRVSAHFLVGRDGWVCQCVRVTREAWHAGVSVWHGRQSANEWALGIEMVNWGKLEGQPRSWRTWVGTPVPDDQVEVIGIAGWQTFPAVQADAVTALCRRLCADFPIGLVLGHDEIAPGRKSDPGPVFPLNALRRQVGLAAIGGRR